MKSIFDLLKSKLTQFIRRKTLRVCSARELAFPISQHQIEFRCPHTHVIHTEMAGVYQFEELVLDKLTGRLFIQPNEAFWPVCIKESSLDDHQVLSLKNSRFHSPRSSNISETVSFERPVIVFNISSKKRNFYHFMVEDAPHLVTALEHTSEPVVILVEHEQPRFIQEFLELVAIEYSARIKYFAPVGKVRITTRVFLFDDVAKRHYGQHSSNVLCQESRIADESEKGLNGCQLPIEFTANVDQNILPKSWSISSGPNLFRAKNNNLQILPSLSGITLLRDCIARIRRDAEQPENGESTVVRVISRHGESSRGRNIQNEDQIVAAISNAEPVSFGGMSLREQFDSSGNTDVLIGLHGAGLTNMLFMTTGSHVIEIAPERQSVPSSNLFENLAGLCGLRYSRVFASSLDASKECLVSPETIEEITCLAASSEPNS